MKVPVPMIPASGSTALVIGLVLVLGATIFLSKIIPPASKPQG
jgi:hypothetical protein